MESADPGTEVVVTPALTAVVELKREQLRELSVVNDHAYHFVAGALKGIKHELKILEELQETDSRPHLDALQKIRDEYRPLKTLWSDMETIAKEKLTAYEQTQDKLREEEQRRLNLAAAAERERLQKAADKLMAQGKVEKAIEKAAIAESIVAPVVQRAAPKVEGLSFSEHWDFEVVNKNDVPDEYKMLDMPLLRKVVSAMKGACRITGIRVFMTRRAASKSKQP